MLVIVNTHHPGSEMYINTNVNILCGKVRKLFCITCLHDRKL